MSADTSLVKEKHESNPMNRNR